LGFDDVPLVYTNSSFSAKNATLSATLPALILEQPFSRMVVTEFFRQAGG
jgi:hypothetical protein